MRSSFAKRRFRVRAASRGFTLIELLIALAVMLIGLVALWRLQASAIASNANAYRLGIATTLAHDAMEQLMEQTFVPGYTDPDLACSSLPLFPPLTEDGLEDLCVLDSGMRVNGLGNTDVTLGPTIFKRTFHTQPLVAGENDRLLIRVRVTYDDPHSAKRHGVTIGATRMVDGYDPLDRGPSSI